MADPQQPPPPPQVKSYGEGVQARTSARQEERRRSPVFPNLAEAAVTPRVAGQTLQDIAEQQRADARDPEAAKQRTGLRPETVEGLVAVRREQDRLEAEAAAARAQAEALTEALPPAKKAPDEEDVPDDAAGEDVALMHAMRAAREDIISNDRERVAVGKRVPPIDLAEGLIDGQFTQVVPVVPGKLTVKFRCLTTGEYDDIRLYLIGRVQTEPQLGEISASLLSFYQTVAAVEKINTTEYAAHMLPEKSGIGKVFSATAFEQKMKQFATFPAPLVAALNAHGVWFERRVRELFVTAEALKNG